MERRIPARYIHRISTLTKKDCYCYAFYIHQLLINSEVPRSRKPNFITVVTRLACRLGLLNELNAYLDAEIQKLVQDGKLVEMPADAENKQCFRFTDIPLVYKQDVKVASEGLPRLPVTLAEINISRCILFGKSSALSDIIHEVILKRTNRLNSFINDVSPAKFLLDSIDISDQELHLLVFLYRWVTFEDFKSKVKSTIPIDSIELFQRMTGIPEKVFEKALRKNQKFLQYGFCDSNGTLTDDMLACFMDQNLEVFFTNTLTDEPAADSFNLSSFSAPKEVTSLMSSLLSGDTPVSLLLYGTSGGGKTEFSRALAGSTGKTVYFFKNENEARNPDDALLKLNRLLSVKQSDSIIIVDEAEYLLRTVSPNAVSRNAPTQTRSIINKMLENNRAKVIFIINNPAQLDESTRRRFSFSYEFQPMSAETLSRIIAEKLDRTDLPSSTKKTVRKLFGKYKITGTSIDNVLKAINCVGAKSSGELLKDINTILMENSKLIYGTPKLRGQVNEAYDSSVLNTTIDADRIISMIENARKFSEKNKCPDNGIRMMFYGLSGTGKTEFARYISGKLGKKMLLKRASDILDKYVGGTEENIADAFAQAAANDEILLFDECDSFFSSREQAEHGWQRSQVNEILTQMEEFPGILICTTNLKQIIDSATKRRFDIICEFKALESEGIEKLLGRYFHAYKFTGEQISRLERYGTITPGDFGAVQRTVRFMPPKDITAEYIIRELIARQEEKEGTAGRIGFCA